MVGKGITSDSQKQGLFLHTAGLELEAVFFTLVSDAEDKNYAATLKLFAYYIIPKANAPFERHLLRQITRVARRRSTVETAADLL